MMLIKLGLYAGLFSEIGKVFKKISDIAAMVALG